MKLIKGIVFDKDGTLFGFHSMWALWCHNVLVELSPDNEQRRFELGAAVGYDTRENKFAAGSVIVNGAASESNQIWCDLLPDKSLLQIESVCQRQMQLLPAAIPVTNLEILCAGLKANGIALGVATNDFESVAVEQLAQINATSLFDFICGFDSGFGAKPEPGMILGFCEKTEIEPSQVAMVGDSCHDLDAGRAAGVGLLVGVLTGPASRSELEELADVVLDDISQLPEYLGLDR